MSLGLLDIICILFLLAGVAFFLGASVGLLRFPDFYTRMHAAGKGDTLSTLMIMAGAAAYELNRFDPAQGDTVSVILTVIKILGIGVFIMLTSPTSTHALMQAGYDDEIEPVGERGHDMDIQLPSLGGRDAGESRPQLSVDVVAIFSFRVFVITILCTIVFHDNRFFDICKPQLESFFQVIYSFWNNTFFGKL